MAAVRKRRNGTSSRDPQQLFFVESPDAAAANQSPPSTRRRHENGVGFRGSTSGPQFADGLPPARGDETPDDPQCLRAARPLLCPWGSQGVADLTGSAVSAPAVPVRTLMEHSSRQRVAFSLTFGVPILELSYGATAILLSPVTPLAYLAVAVALTSFRICHGECALGSSSV